MAFDENEVKLSGRIGEDVVIRETGKGNRVASVRVATSESAGKDEKGEWRTNTTWNTIEAWNEGADILKEAGKGARIRVSGALRMDSWADGQGKKHQRLFIVAKGIELLERPREAASPENEMQAQDQREDDEVGL